MSDSEAGHEDVVVNENTGRGDENEQSHFDITKWAQNCKINRKTVSVLRKEEVTSIETLTLLTQSDLACLGRTTFGATKITGSCNKSVEVILRISPERATRQ